MALHADNFAIALTPSLILDGHFPDGNDGSGAIPLTWAHVPDFTGNQVGTPFSVQLFTVYLTQPGGNTATASLLSGTLSGGWALASNGTLSWDGTGVLSGTIQVRATRAGVTSDSNFFNIQSVAVIPNPDTLAPTIPTGLALVSKTATQINVTCDAPSDVPTATVPASGMLQVRFFKNGAFDGVSAVTGGRSVQLTAADIGGGSARRWPGGWWTAVSPGQRNAWVANPALVANNTGPVVFTGSVASPTLLTKALNFRHNWNSIETTPNHFNLNSMIGEYNACASLGIMCYFTMIVRSFSLSDNPAPGAGQGPGGSDIDLALLTDQWHTALGDGYQMRRWNATVSNRFNNLVKAVGSHFDGLQYFGGIGTQETSSGSPAASTGYNLTDYQTALIAEANNIGAAIPSARHLWFFNFIHSGGMKDLGPVAVAVQANGGIIGGPDLVVGGGITNSCYPIYAAVQNGVGTVATGTAGDVSKGWPALAGTSPTMCCLQPAEWKSSVPPGQDPANSPCATILQRCQYGMGISPYASASVLRLSGIMPDWHTAITAPGTEKFNPGASDVITTYPSFNVWVPPGSLAPGSMTQSGVDYTVTGAGAGIGASSDQWSVIRVASNGAFTIIAKLNGITGTDTTAAVAGLTIREDTSSSAAAAHLIVGTTHIISRYRATAGGAMNTVVTVAGQTWTGAKWLKLARSGTTFSWFWSSDGLGWNAIGTATISMKDSVYAELFACSQKTTTVTATFNQVNIQALSPPTYSYTGLTTATSYALTATSRDIAVNDSLSSPTLTVVTS